MKELASNRRAHFDYEILDTFEAGLVLMGSEVKSLRVNGASLQEGYVQIKSGELWLFGVSIAPYSFSSHFGHEERRERKLLMHKNEILRLEAKVAEKGFTLVPLSLYLKEGRVKLKFALAKGKRLHDKRKKIEEKETQRALKQAREY